MIAIKNLEKTYDLHNHSVHAVNDVTLNIGDGEIYGVIGYSGAGKSTLVRCINFLEKPDAGTIEITGFGRVIANSGRLFLERDGKQAPLTDKELRSLRRSIGMIFQHFNLLDRSTVFDNIAYPLRYRNYSKEEIRNRVNELLKLVDLEDKRDVYPSQLSGGQKQRVAIARALADSPKVLLCDEATSALDPDATDSILHLLKDLNRKLGLTIVLITHEMAVVKEIADHVAVMENGKVVEEGEVYDLFATPRQVITKRFVGSSNGLCKINKLIADNAVDAVPTDTKKLIRLTFIRSSVNDALISRVSRKFDVDLSIVLANVDLVEDTPLGSIIVELSGEASHVKAALEYIHESGVRVEGVENERSFSKLVS